MQKIMFLKGVYLRLGVTLKLWLTPKSWSAPEQKYFPPLLLSVMHDIEQLSFNFLFILFN